MKEAMFYKSVKDKVRCLLCPHFCLIENGKRGKCGVRENIDGKLYSLNYGKVIANSVDPVEKKPLFHFMPGTKTYSIATVGCNLFCEFCQNWEISQDVKEIIGKEMTPSEIVEDAIQKGCKSIAYTYTEPTIFFEFAYDTAKLAKKKGLKNIFVSNGFINKEAIDKISEYLDAINIDLKGFSEDYYKRYCGARLEPVLDAIKHYHKKVWLELTTLIVPGHNDDEESFEKITDLIISLDKNIPWHISRFHPDYKMIDVPVTSMEAIDKAYAIGKKKGIKYIYTGNVYDDRENTYCPKCGKVVIDRKGMHVNKINLDKDRCKFCKAKIDIVS